MRKGAFGFSKNTIIDLLIQYLRKNEINGQIPENSNVADLGCGYDAFFLTSISPHIKQGFGFDSSFKNKIFPENIKLIRADLDYKIPLTDKSVDVVTSLAVLEHLHKPEAMLRESYRILKPQGILMITTPSHFSKPLLEFLAYKLRIISIEEIRDHKRYYSKKSLFKAITDAGYKNTLVKYFELGLNLFAKACK